MKNTFLTYLLIAVNFISVFASEFQINTRTTYDQTDADIATDANGNFVVVWKSYLHPLDGSSWGIMGQRFNKNCEYLGDEFIANTTTAGNQKDPSVAMNAAGGFVVVWQGPGSDEEDIFGRLFDPNGQALGGEFLVNTYTQNRQFSPDVSMNDDGNFVIVWESENITADLSKRSICGRLYNDSGVALGPEFVVNDEISTCRYPDVAMHDSGKFIVVWTKDISLKSIWVRHFDANGTAPYLSSRVNDNFNFTSLTEPSVAIDAVGNYMIVWDGHPETYLQDDIYLKRYHWSHAPIHEQFLVNTYRAGAQSDPSVAVSDDGRFIVIWQSDTDSETTKKDIFAQRFPAQGEHIGDPILTGDQFKINTYIVDEQRCPAVAMSDTGRFFAVWESNEQDGSGYGIFGEIGPVSGSADFSGDGFVNFRDYCVLAGEWLKDANCLEADLIDDKSIDKYDLAAFCQQWLTHCYQCSEVDIDSDGKINFKDYARWSANWLTQGPNLDGDISRNGIVDMADLKALLLHWADGCE